MDDRKQTQVVNGLLDILKTLLQGAQSKDELAKKTALAKSEKILKGLKP